MVAHILEMKYGIYGLTSKDVRSIASQLEDKHGIVHLFSEQTCFAGKDLQYMTQTNFLEYCPGKKL